MYSRSRTRSLAVSSTECRCAKQRLQSLDFFAPPPKFRTNSFEFTVLQVSGGGGGGCAPTTIVSGKGGGGASAASYFTYTTDLSVDAADVPDDWNILCEVSAGGAGAVADSSGALSGGVGGQASHLYFAVSNGAYSGGGTGGGNSGRGGRPINTVSNIGSGGGAGASINLRSGTLAGMGSSDFAGNPATDLASNGGSSNPSFPYYAGGGGGAGGPGEVGGISGSDGGIGVTLSEFPGWTFGGGGGGGKDSGSSASHGNATHGGGAGGQPQSAGQNGLANTGGGGGGAGEYISGSLIPGGNGGSGLVVFRYPATIQIPSGFREEIAGFTYFGNKFKSGPWIYHAFYGVGHLDMTNLVS